MMVVYRAVMIIYKMQYVMIVDHAEACTLRGGKGGLNVPVAVDGAEMMSSLAISLGVASDKKGSSFLSVLLRLL